MIEKLGILRGTRGIQKTSRLAAGAVRRYGEAAIFHRLDTGVCAVLSRTDPFFEPEMRKHRADVVGVYAATSSAYVLAQWIEADLREHQREEISA